MTRPLVRIRRLEGSDAAVALPSYETPGAAGADIRANLPQETRAAGVTLAPLARALIPTGLAMEIEPGYEVQIRPRSGLALKQGLTLLNTPGTIDADYRGPLGIIMVNLGQDAATITHGERIAQMIVAPAPQARIEEVAVLTETARGAGGFGSTGRT